MEGFNVNVVSADGNGRVPVGLAGQIMIDIQRLLGDIGEYLIAKELRIQDSIRPELLNRFILYLDEKGGMSIGSSPQKNLIEGCGNIVDDAITLMNSVLSALGSGITGYWMEDRFSDPIYRTHIILDVLTIHEHMAMAPGYELLFGFGDNLNKFGEVAVDKLYAFIKDKGACSPGSTMGVLVKVPTRSKGDLLYLQCGSSRAKTSFNDKSAENRARGLVGSPVILTGMLQYSNSGELLEIKEITAASPVSSVSFKRMISGDGDIALTTPLQADVVYSSGIWTIRNDELGISSTKDSWDSVVQSFHDYFVFLWMQYSEKEVSGEEKETADCLRSLV